MNRDLIIRPEAEADIAQAFDWYETRVEGLGSEFLLVLDAAFHSIVRSPDSYPQIYKQVRALTRRFPLPFSFWWRRVTWSFFRYSTSNETRKYGRKEHEL
jgi:hypothetical protein